ncbi:MAG TPA: adenylate/guanylate cyclase domain-containing protein [Solirubrobacterales bacterium]|nr:adenylate/guanylate cyclase domain-containing protein [Solirubrobacterales bacterium]
MQPPHTFLFSDLVGYTALADLEGDHRAAEVALELQRRVRALLPGYGAEEVKALGDGIMLRCGDPAAAIKLGLRIVATLEDDPAFPLVRIGIHSGEAVTHDGDWYGRTVNVAARLCAVAPGGEVLVSDATRSAAGRMRKIDFGERRMHWLRNVTEPVATFSARERACWIENVRGVVERAGRRSLGPAGPVEAV